jgi:maltose/moltooligosaccharide transporter
MFANYNLIAALAFLLPLLAKYTVVIHCTFIALVCGGLGLISIYFIQEPTALHYGMVRLVLELLGQVFCSYVMLSGSLLLTKWAITWEF